MNLFKGLNFLSGPILFMGLFTISSKKVQALLSVLPRFLSVK
jgi:hypothetical protein